jgi:hypothetical protein
MPTLLAVVNDAYTRNPSPSVAYFMMGLNALVFLEGDQYKDRLSAILDGANVQRIPGKVPFVPAVLIISQAGFYIVAVEGTRGFTAWVNYVTGAGVVNYPRDRGDVFAPFAASALGVLPEVLEATGGADVVFLSGHSLGAAVAGMLTASLFDAGKRTPASYLFACPRFASTRFRVKFDFNVHLFNHPLDPVPLLPPDPVALVGRNPFEARWSYGMGQVAEPRWLPAGILSSIPTNTSDWLAAVAVNSMDIANSPHNTYRYIREMAATLSAEERATWFDFTVLLSDLGLLDPWPA